MFMYNHWLRRLLTVLVPLTVLSFVHLYLYPVFHGCAFPLPPPSYSKTFSPGQSAYLNTFQQHINDIIGTASNSEIAPFRLLVLADPQIEGDTSLPDPKNGFYQRLSRRWSGIARSNTTSDVISAVQKAVRNVIFTDIPFSLRAARKRLDLFGNDFYLAHIYRTLRWWTKPSHVTVLGDLVGSQWVTDTEFERRAWRYWNRVFGGGVRVDDEITATGGGVESVKEERLQALDANDSSWSNRIISLAGNHDVGYSGDITEARIVRFERAFGRANWDVRFQYKAAFDNAESTVRDTDAEATVKTIPSIHLIVLNSLSLDTPALSTSVQSQTYNYINDVISQRSSPVEDRASFTLLLTHVPLHKREGICTDAPYFAFHKKDDDSSDTGEPRFKAGGLREQNHLSDYVSHSGILQGLLGMSGDEKAAASGKGRNGLILTGHDHTGCDVVHYVHRQDSEEESGEGGASWSWDARRYTSTTASNQTNSSPNIREVTLRSMMGEFGGNAGLLSLWFNQSSQEWQYEITTCQIGVQHIWWAVHALGLVTLLMFLLGFVGGAVFTRRSGTKHSPPTVTEKKMSPPRNGGSHEMQGGKQKRTEKSK